MDEKVVPAKERRLVESVIQACVRAALDAYEGALQDGLCCEGGFEVAIGAMRMLDPGRLIARNDAG